MFQNDKNYDNITTYPLYLLFKVVDDKLEEGVIFSFTFPLGKSLWKKKFTPQP